MGKPLEAAGERFGRDQVRRILRLSERQWKAWERQGLVQPAQPSPGGQAASLPRDYTFSDIIKLKTLLQLRKSGVPAARLRLAHAALKAKLAEVKAPWSELQIRGSGKNLTVQFRGATMEPVSGQLLLDYAPREPQDAKRRIQQFQRTDHRKKRSTAEKKAIAERFFAMGLRFEERAGKTNNAIQAYQRAIEMNPEAIGAFINLGTIYYNLGQLEAAESSYLAALSLDPAYGLVHFNLGNVFDERNELPKARHHYEEAVRRDPDYPDPHYNLALVYEKLGLHGKARQQWLRYLKWDQESNWASYARQQLDRTPLRLVDSQRPSA